MMFLEFTVVFIPVKASGTIYIRPDVSVDPLTAPISSVDNVTYTFPWNDLTVTIISNSTISDFKVGRTVIKIIGNFSLDVAWNSASGTRFIMFNVTGPISSKGFCHVAIPKALMYDIDTIGTGITRLNYTEADNDTHMGAYFLYPHITDKMRIEISGPIDETPPNITDMCQTPIEVLPEDEVRINAAVTDDQSGVRRMILDYNNGTQTWRKEMIKIESNIWSATIPRFSTYTNVSYTITAEDNAANTITTEVYKYHVIPPTEGDKGMHTHAVLIAALLIALVIVVTGMAALKKRRKQQHIIGINGKLYIHNLFFMSGQS